jgi:hypothetical protein
VNTGEFFLGRESGRGVKLTTQMHLMPRPRQVELYLCSLICPDGIELIYLSTGTTLPLPYLTIIYLQYLLSTLIFVL